MRFKQGQQILLWFISLLGLGAYPANCASPRNALPGDAEIQHALNSPIPTQPTLLGSQSSTSSNSFKFLAELQQVKGDLESAILPMQPTTTAAFGLARSSHSAASLRLSPKSPPVVFAASKLKALEPSDVEVPISELARDRSSKPLQKTTAIQPLLAADPDLGNLRLQESPDRPVIPGSPSDPNSPFAPPIPVGCDPELGCLRLQSPVVTTTPPPVMYLLPRLDIFRSNNILSGLNPVEEGLIRPAISLLILPALGSSTYLNVSAEGALNQYFSLTQFNYSEVKFKAGIFQRLSPSMSAEIGWTNQQFFISSNQIFGLSAGTRFLNDHSIRLELSRQDQLAKNLSLSSFYQFRVSFTEPSDRSRIINVLFLSLNYSLNPRVQLGLDYQFASANFTVQPRTDLYHQVLGRISYSAFRTAQISLYGGISTGTSTERAINFNSFLLGISVSVSLVIF
ncbi:MAG: hypothetical protein DCF22_09800 [Leptolyngbya sp.]|nr:MAG: hypothetical protein DCF22_09800 [Leptolyngbya sp.]